MKTTGDLLVVTQNTNYTVRYRSISHFSNACLQFPNHMQKNLV